MTGDNDYKTERQGSREGEWFTIDRIRHVDNREKLYCLKVDSPDHEFLIGKTGIPTHNTDEAKAAQALKGEASSIIGSIARLGRAAGVHLLIATQRPDAKLLPGETKANLGMRAACGNMTGNASQMVLENGDGVKTPGSPKGRAIIKIYSNQANCQVYFTTPKGIDEWLARRGRNPDGTPISTGPAGIIAEDNMEAIRGTNMNEVQGVDNSQWIAEQKEKDAQQKAMHAANLAAAGLGADSRDRLAADSSQMRSPIVDPNDRGLDSTGERQVPVMHGSDGSSGNSRPENDWNNGGGVMDELQAASDDDDNGWGNSDSDVSDDDSWDSNDDADSEDDIDLGDGDDLGGTDDGDDGPSEDDSWQ